MNIAFFWTGATAPLAACWRALADRPGVRVKVYLELARQSDAPVDVGRLLQGLDYEVHFADEPLDRLSLQASVAAFAPDLIVVIGWRSPMGIFAAESPAFAAVKKIFAFDMPWQWKVRKLVAPLFLWRYLRRFSAAFVPGGRSAAYARWLGFRKSQIDKGLISLNPGPYAAAAQQRNRLPSYPRDFLYVGRYAPEKRIDVLVAAYARYRSAVTDPWGLTCCGTGPEAGRLRGKKGIADRGFVQPNDLPSRYGLSGAFVIASDYEPWGMVILEAAMSGLPIICTTACGAHVDLVRTGVNGIVCKTDSIDSLAAAMQWVHENEVKLERMGSRAIAAAADFSADAWADKVLLRLQLF